MIVGTLREPMIPWCLWARRELLEAADDNDDDDLLALDVWTREQAGALLRRQLVSAFNLSGGCRE